MPTTISQSLLAEFDHEMANTRKTLERVPDNRPDFRPHARSMTLARLAGHLVDLHWWALATLTRDVVDLNPADAADGPARTVMASRAELLTRFDEASRQSREALAATDDAAMQQRWTLKRGGHEVFGMPRLSVFRSLIMNHNIHHRAQLGVYLRLNDVPVPSMYGPSADEGGL